MKRKAQVPTAAMLAPGALADDAVRALYSQVRDVLVQARQQAHRSINQAMVLAYWQVGRLVVEHEQAGQARAGYGERLLPNLAERLSAEFGAGFAVQSLRNYRQLYLVLPGDEIRSTPWSELSWSHLRVLMRLADPAARQWYAREAVSQVWWLPTAAELQAELPRDRELLDLGREEAPA